MRMAFVTTGSIVRPPIPASSPCPADSLRRTEAASRISPMRSKRIAPEAQSMASFSRKPWPSAWAASRSAAKPAGNRASTSSMRSGGSLATVVAFRDVSPGVPDHADFAMMAEADSVAARHAFYDTEASYDHSPCDRAWLDHRRLRADVLVLAYVFRSLSLGGRVATETIRRLRSQTDAVRAAADFADPGGLHRRLGSGDAAPADDAGSTRRRRQAQRGDHGGDRTVRRAGWCRGGLRRLSARGDAASLWQPRAEHRR